MGQHHQRSLEMGAQTTTEDADEVGAVLKMSGEVFTPPVQAAASASDTGAPPAASKPNMIDGIEHFPELDSRAEAVVAQMLKPGNGDVFETFQKLAGDGSMSQYNAFQVAGALTEAAKKLDPTGRFEFGAGTNGHVNVYDKLNPLRDEQVLGTTQMYDAAALAKVRDADNPDETATARAAKAFAAHDFNGMTAAEINAAFNLAVKEMVDANADPSFAAGEMRDALRDAGSNLEVHARRGQITLQTHEVWPHGTIQVKEGF